jgi:Xaa-Pro aminopeptidase
MKSDLFGHASERTASIPHPDKALRRPGRVDRPADTVSTVTDDREFPEATAAANPVPQALLDHLAAGWIDIEPAPAAPDPRCAAWADRRRRLSAQFPDRTLVIPAGGEIVRNGTTTYHFRPASDHVYLCGATAPDSVLVIRPGGESELYTPAPHERGTHEWFTDAARSELWAGPQPRLDALEEQLGLPVRPLSTLDASLRDAPEPPDVAVAVARMRLVKDSFEIASLREAAAASLLAHRELEAALPEAIAGGGEKWLEGTFLRRCSVSGNGPGYWPIVGAGDHACILHWHRNDGPVHADDLVLVDAAVEGHDLYTADVTRTYAASGRMGSAQQAVYDVVLAAHDAAIASVAPGIGFHDPQDVGWDVLVDGLIELGVLRPSQRGVALDPDTMLHRRYTLHRMSHHLGLDVHDSQLVASEYRSGRLEPGMVFTIEPGLYFRSNDETVPPALRGIGVRIEDDILCTPDGADVLTREE